MKYDFDWRKAFFPYLPGTSLKYVISNDVSREDSSRKLFAQKF